MLFKTSRGGVKTAFEYVSKIPFTKKLLHRINEMTRGPMVVFFSLHRVLDEHDAEATHPHILNKSALTTKDARKFLSHIKKTLPFIPLIEALPYLKGDAPLKQSVAVLLVEAPYKESFRNLMPLASDLNIPFSVALSSHSLATGEPPWMDEVSFRIMSTNKEELVVNFIDRSFALSGSAERIWAANHIVENLSHCHQRLLLSRLYHLRDLLHETALPPKSERIASIPELQKLSKHPLLSFVVSGQLQMPLFELEIDEAKKESLGAKEELAALFGDALLPVFFYPFGLGKIKNLSLTKTMIEGGYEAAITRVIGIARPGDNMFRLPSLPLDLGSNSFAQFELQGLSDAIDEFLLVTLAKDKEY